MTLTSRRVDSAHPAFQKLFLETEYVAEDATLIARRRSRDKLQKPLYALHTLAVSAGVASSVQWRQAARFLGRLGDIENPAALYKSEWGRKNGGGTGYDFCTSMHSRNSPGESVVIGMTTAMAESEEEAKQLGDLYHDLRGVQRALELAWAFAQVETHQDSFEPRKFICSISWQGI